jgi:hypothetical protein
MKVIPLEERKAILLELQVEQTGVVMKRHNIDHSTMSHIRYYHGPSSAASNGDYYKDLLGDSMHPIAEEVRKLKSLGLNSLQISRQLDIPLEKLNLMWDSISVPFTPSEPISWSISL